MSPNRSPREWAMDFLLRDCFPPKRPNGSSFAENRSSSSSSSSSSTTAAARIGGMEGLPGALSPRAMMDAREGWGALSSSSSSSAPDSAPAAAPALDPGPIPSPDPDPASPASAAALVRNCAFSMSCIGLPERGAVGGAGGLAIRSSASGPRVEGRGGGGGGMPARPVPPIPVPPVSPALIAPTLPVLLVRPIPSVPSVLSVLSVAIVPSEPLSS
mmetsp:Transcript_8865/g.19368  ORF Transcript_8865/g.19368 Transcript_8865/m.19368 type:complete len:215 (-) Transcript_8865:29-673(-)